MISLLVGLLPLLEFDERVPKDPLSIFVFDLLCTLWIYFIYLIFFFTKQILRFSIHRINWVFLVFKYFFYAKPFCFLSFFIFFNNSEHTAILLDDINQLIINPIFGALIVAFISLILLCMATIVFIRSRFCASHEPASAGNNLKGNHY